MKGDLWLTHVAITFWTISNMPGNCPSELEKLFIEEKEWEIHETYPTDMPLWTGLRNFSIMQYKINAL